MHIKKVLNCIIYNSGIMCRGLLVLMAIGSVDSGVSESKFGASVSSTVLAWASEEFPSDS